MVEVKKPGIFSDIELNWKGRGYIIPARRVMGAIAALEDVVTMAELSAGALGGKVKLTRIAMGYAAILRYAGADVDDEEVYAGLFQHDGQSVAMTAVQSLLMMMIPTSVKPSQKQVEENTPKGKAVRAASSSSKSRTKRR